MPLPLAAAPLPQPEPPAVMPEALPWDVEPMASAPIVRPAPRKPAIVAAAPERLHWPVIALTAVTALLLICGTRADDTARAWAFPADVAATR